MRIEHRLALCAGQIPERERPMDTCVAVFCDGGLEKVHPVVDEGFAVRSGCAEVDELDLVKRNWKRLVMIGEKVERSGDHTVPVVFFRSKGSWTSWGPFAFSGRRRALSYIIQGYSLQSVCYPQIIKLIIDDM